MRRLLSLFFLTDLLVLAGCNVLGSGLGIKSIGEGWLLWTVAGNFAGIMSAAILFVFAYKGKGLLLAMAGLPRWIPTIYAMTCISLAWIYAWVQFGGMIIDALSEIKQW